MDVEPLPASVDSQGRCGSGAPQLFEEPGNIGLDWSYGDHAEVEAAMARAAHVTRLRVVNNRVVVAPMEPRARGRRLRSGDGRFMLRSGCQGVFGLRRAAGEDC